MADLIQRGANIAASDKNGDTALHIAAKRGFNEIAKELLKWGADPHTVNNNWKIPLEIAVNLALEGSEESAVDFSNLAVTVIQEMEPARYANKVHVHL